MLQTYLTYFNILQQRRCLQSASKFMFTALWLVDCDDVLAVDWNIFHYLERATLTCAWVVRLTLNRETSHFGALVNRLNTHGRGIQVGLPNFLLILLGRPDCDRWIARCTIIPEYSRSVRFTRAILKECCFIHLRLSLSIFDTCFICTLVGLALIARPKTPSIISLSLIFISSLRFWIDFSCNWSHIWKFLGLLDQF